MNTDSSWPQRNAENAKILPVEYGVATKVGFVQSEAMTIKIDARYDLTDECDDCDGIPKVINLDTGQTFGPDIIVQSIAGETLRQALPGLFANRALNSTEKALLDSFLKTSGSE